MLCVGRCTVLLMLLRLDHKESQSNGTFEKKNIEKWDALFGELVYYIL